MGKTMLHQPNLLISRKHPHAHGEDKKKREVSDRKAETPPRAWGRRDVTRSRLRASRNTPTRMGKTIFSREQSRSHKKHPHAHGEDTRRFGQKKKKEETPPRAWGRPQNTAMNVSRVRNTPTRMGKTGVLA